MDTIALARFLNQISETETHFDNMSKKIQSIYERRAMQIMLFMMDNGFGSECTDQERLDYFSAGFCSGYKSGGVEEDWIDEAFCAYEKKRQEKSVGAKNTEQLLQPDNGVGLPRCKKDKNGHCEFYPLDCKTCVMPLPVN